MNTMTKTLEELVNIPSPTGYSVEIVRYLEDFLKKENIRYYLTNKGAVIAEIPGETEESILFSAHVDTLGAVVKEIKSNGRLKLSLMGGYTWATLDAENCVLRTRKNDRYTGTVQSTKPSVHIDGPQAHSIERNQDNTEMILDEKIFTREEAENLGIMVGDFIFVEPRFTYTEKGFIKSRYLDDKASVAILLEAMKRLNKEKQKNKLYFFISTYEEIGHGAASAIPEGVKEFIAVDMGAPGNGQASSEYKVNICAKDSSGPYDLEIKDRMIDLCEENNIPYTVDIYNYYGSDASAALRAGYDLRTGLIGAGVFASHGYERTHEESMEATLNLVLAYAKRGM